MDQPRHDLVIEDLWKSFRTTRVLSGIHLTVPQGAFVAVLGSSGSGKTTLLRAIAGFERPDQGSIRLGARVFDDGKQHLPVSRRHIGYVAQEGNLFPNLTVFGNTAFGVPRGEDKRARAEQLIELFGLQGLERRYPHELSGGQQQRVSVARALGTEPQLILLDEPFASLDMSLRAAVRGEVQRILRASGTTTVLVTHDQDEALSMADAIAFIRRGRIVQVDTPKTLYRHPVDRETAASLGEMTIIGATPRGESVATVFGCLPLDTSLGESSAEVDVLIRPEQVVMSHDRDAPRFVVERVEYHGATSLAALRSTIEEAGPEVLARVPADLDLVVGRRYGFRVEGAVTVWPSAAPQGSGRE